MGSYRGQRCMVLDDLGDRLHIAYLGHDAYQAQQLGYWQVDRGVFELVTPREEVTDITEERSDYLDTAAEPAPDPQPAAGYNPTDYGPVTADYGPASDYGLATGEFPAVAGLAPIPPRPESAAASPGGRPRPLSPDFRTQPGPDRMPRPLTSASPEPFTAARAAGPLTPGYTVTAAAVPGPRQRRPRLISGDARAAGTAVADETATAGAGGHDHTGSAGGARHGHDDRHGAADGHSTHGSSAVTGRADDSIRPGAAARPRIRPGAATHERPDHGATANGATAGVPAVPGATANVPAVPGAAVPGAAVPGAAAGGPVRSDRRRPRAAAAVGAVPDGHAGDLHGTRVARGHSRRRLRSR